MMFRQRRRIQLPVAGMILLCLLGGIYLFAGRHSAKPDPASTVKKHAAETSPDETLRYWTAERMRKAKPAKLPHINGGDKGKQNPQRPAEPRNSD